MTLLEQAKAKRDYASDIKKHAELVYSMGARDIASHQWHIACEADKDADALELRAWEEAKNGGVIPNLTSFTMAEKDHA